MPNETDGGSQNPPDTQNQISPEVGNFINAAVTAQLKRFAEKQLPDVLKGHLESAMKPVLEKLSAPPPAPQGDDEEQRPKGKKSAPSPEVAALEQKLQDTLKALKDAEDRRVATEKKAREDRAYSEFKVELGKHVRPDVLDMVADYLFRAQSVVDVQEDGNAYFKSTRNSYGIEEDIRLPIKDGVESWAKSDAAKPFLPSPGVSHADPLTKKKVVMAPMPKDIDLDKATPEQKVQMAMQKAEELGRKLAEQGIKI